jgi:hypothetical protein
MKNVTTALAAAGLLALSACGGGSDGGAANNSVENVNVSADDLTATDTLDANALGNDANALGTSNLTDRGNLGNAADANATDAANASANSTGNSQ